MPAARLGACLVAFCLSGASVAYGGPSSARLSLPALPAGLAQPVLAGLTSAAGPMASLSVALPQLPRFDGGLPAVTAGALAAVPLPPAAPASVSADMLAAALAAAAPAPLERYRQIAAHSPSLFTALDEAQMSGLWKRAFMHKVAGLDDEAKLKKYDPDGIIGFCFGRAMAVHLLARQMGLAANSIRHLFVVGDLRSGEQPEWRFHVATLVKGSDGQWHAIDPIMDGPLTADGWIDKVHEGWDKARKARFYVVGADAVIPDITSVPDLPKERSSKLIELAFDPRGKAGFSLWREVRQEVYELDAPRQDEHFRVAGSEIQPFDFLAVSVNGQSISYNGYFVDLLAELAHPTDPKTRGFKPYGTPRRSKPPLGLRVEAFRR